MNAPEEDLNDLAAAIKVYCGCLLEYDQVLEACKCPPSMHSGAAKNDSANRLIAAFNRFLPDLSLKLNHRNQPVSIYVEDFIDYGVNGVDDKLISLLWKEYFLGSRLVSEVATQANYSERTIYRQREKFPHRIAAQLWRMNREITMPPSSVAIQTKNQRYLAALRGKFYLTDRESEILLIYARPGPPIGLQAIAQMLHISKNTIKYYRRSILQKIPEDTLNQAANIVRKFLQEIDPAEWPNTQW